MSHWNSVLILEINDNNPKNKDKDGRLSSGEFVSAMALCEAASRGTPIPEQLPAELGKPGGIVPQQPLQQPEQNGGRLGLEEERRRNMEKGMAELERRREAIRLREEAERLEAEKRRAQEEAERRRLAEEAERKRKEEEERLRQLEEQERQRKHAEAERARYVEIERKKAEMTLEKKRLQEQLDVARHRRDQLEQEQGF